MSKSSSGQSPSTCLGHECACKRCERRVLVSVAGNCLGANRLFSFGSPKSCAAAGAWRSCSVCQCLYKITYAVVTDYCWRSDFKMEQFIENRNSVACRIARYPMYWRNSPTFSLLRQPLSLPSEPTTMIFRKATSLLEYGY